MSQQQYKLFFHTESVLWFNVTESTDHSLYLPGLSLKQQTSVLEGGLTDTVMEGGEGGNYKVSDGK